LKIGNRQELVRALLEKSRTKLEEAKEAIESAKGFASATESYLRSWLKSESE
jgi:hypothetical protein